MSNPLFTPTMTVLALAAIVSIVPARGSAAPAKPAELHTIGAPARPDAAAADPRAQRPHAIPGSTRPSPIGLPRGEKPAAFETRSAAAPD